ncbi:DUF7344 domain-containing protein [Haladaptatus sp. NG-WS-4]
MRDRTWRDLTLPCSLTAALNVVDDSLSRAVLRQLVMCECQLTLSELAVVCSDERSVSKQRHRRITVELHHITLPRLADCGFVHYDARTNTVERALDSATIRSFLDVEIER